MTEAPLRMLLMIRSIDGAWVVTVCRALGIVMRTWQARKEPDRDVAVLHVGFDRPPPCTFDEIADAHQGRMLLSAAAKHVLPNSFVSSAAPVGVVERTEIFIGLQGWGYSLEDHTARADRPAATDADAAAHEPRGWIASFLNENSSATEASAAEALSAGGVHDDASYLEHEFDLARSIRHRLGVFRARYLVGAECDDPCELARAAPPWLVERSLADLDLPGRVNNVFRINEIEMVRDLAAWSPDALLNQPNFGRKSLQDTLQALNAALSGGPPRSSTEESASKSGRLLTELRRSLLLLPDRERDILVRRLGFETVPETLQQVAHDYGVTRERIRQIELRATQRWIHKSYWDDILEQKIVRLLVGRNFPLSMARVEEEDSWFDGVSSHLDFFKNVIQMSYKDRIRFVEIDDVSYFSLMGQEIWERAVSEAAALLSVGAGQEWSENYTRSLVHGLLPDIAREFGSLLWDRASRLCHFSTGPAGSRILLSYGRGTEQLVEAILAESDTPLHYTEIATRAGLRKGTDLDQRTVHNAASSTCFLLGRGTYGLGRHIPLSDGQMSRIRTEAEDIVRSGASGRQWHTSEILSELSERLDGGLDELDKYVLDIALAGSGVLSCLGKMTWIETGQDTDDQTRIHVQKAIISIVKAADRPLSTGEIKERLTAVRGVSRFFQISPIDPLIRVRPGVWGINDRDVPLSREEQAELLQELVQILEEKQRGIHVSELSGILPLRDCPPDVLLSLAVQDGRLRNSQGRHVYLAEWGSSRRETVGHAVSTVMENARKPLTLDEIVVQVERLVGRTCDRPVISGALQALKAQYDETNREWSLNRSAVAE